MTLAHLIKEKSILLLLILITGQKQQISLKIIQQLKQHLLTLETQQLLFLIKEVQDPSFYFSNDGVTYTYCGSVASPINGATSPGAD